MNYKSSLKFREITRDSHLETYSQFTQRYLDVRYPTDYLRRSKVVALVSENEYGEIQSIFGGYILALSHPFRVLEQLPNTIVENHPHLQKKWNECLELTGLWVHPMIKNGQIRFRLWWKLFRDLMSQSFKGRPYILYSYDASKKHLGEMYRLSKPHRIFEGYVYIPGMTEENKEIVEMGSTRAVMKAFFASPMCIVGFIAKRLLRKRKELHKKSQLVSHGR